MEALYRRYYYRKLSPADLAGRCIDMYRIGIRIVRLPVVSSISLATVDHLPPRRLDARLEAARVALD